MKSFAAVTVCGYVGRDTELRRTQSGVAVRSISVATSGRRDEEPVWWSLALFGVRAEKLEIRKGDLVMATASITHCYVSDRGNVSVEGRIESISLLPKQVTQASSDQVEDPVDDDSMGETIPF